MKSDNFYLKKNILSEWLKENNILQKDFAHTINIHQNTFSGMMNQKTTVGRKTRQAICLQVPKDIRGTLFEEKKYVSNKT